MRKLKNNKGLTGIDIVVSISLIVIVLGIVIAVYSSYSNKSKEVKRTSIATNLAMTVIESIEAKNINEIGNAGTDVINISNGYGVDSVPTGYSITAKKVESTNPVLQNIAFQVDVTVSYKVKNEDKKITLSTVKKYDDYEVREAVPPKLESIPVKGWIAVKKDSAKGGYVKVDTNDSEWYSISSKVLPIVVKLNGNEKFDRNGVIKLSQCDYIYAWVPYFGTYSSKNRFCDASSKIIQYKEDSGISKYTLTNLTVPTRYGGTWQRLNQNEEPINSSEEVITSNGNDYNKIKNNVFSWE